MWEWFTFKKYPFAILRCAVNQLHLYASNFSNTSIANNSNSLETHSQSPSRKNKIAKKNNHANTIAKKTINNHSNNPQKNKNMTIKDKNNETKNKLCQRINLMNKKLIFYQ